MKDFFKKLIYNGSTGEPSLTALLVIIFAVVAGYGAINEFVMGGAEPKAAVDLFWGVLVAYTGRRISVGNKNYSGEDK
jgi:hypothetical protein